MEIRGTKTEQVKITISTEETARITRETIANACDLKFGADWYGIKDGNLVAFVDHGGHGSGYVEEKPIRKATDLDIAAVQVLDAVEKWGRMF